MSTDKVDVLFLEVDMSGSRRKSCGPCDVAQKRLTTAIDLAGGLLAEAGYEVRVNKVQVTTEEQAKQLNFVASPTLRVAGASIAPRHVPDSENRVWSWGGKDFDEPPVGLFLDLILQGMRTKSSPATDGFEEEIPLYLKRYLRPETAHYPRLDPDHH